MYEAAGPYVKEKNDQHYLRKTGSRGEDYKIGDWLPIRIQPKGIESLLQRGVDKRNLFLLKESLEVIFRK